MAGLRTPRLRYEEPYSTLSFVLVINFYLKCVDVRGSCNHANAHRSLKKDTCLESRLSIQLSQKREAHASPDQSAIKLAGKNEAQTSSTDLSRFLRLLWDSAAKIMRLTAVAPVPPVTNVVFEG